MTEATRILVGTSLPPIALDSLRPRPARWTDPLQRIRRLAWVVAGLALPILGLSVADAVHRAGEPGIRQAAAPLAPSDGVAAPGSIRAIDGAQVALLDDTPRTIRP